MRVTVPKEMSMFLKSIIEVKSAFNIDLRRSRGPYRFLYKKRLRVSLLPVDGKLSPQHAPPPVFCHTKSGATPPEWDVSS